jgi:cell division protein FtsI/penicillin-binding protein 2
MSAFVVVGAVMLAVAGWTARLARAGAQQPDRLRQEEGPPPAYSIADREGREIARFVPRFDLELSPRSLWQAHTPLRIAGGLSAALGGSPTPEELLALLLPDARDGVIEVEAWELSLRQAQLVHDWIAEGAGSGAGALQGLWLERRGDHFRVLWRPEVLLSEAERRRHGTSGAWRWARRLADGLDRCLAERPAEPVSDTQARERREAVWRALLPTAFCRPLRGIEPDLVLPLRKELERQGIASWQMKVAYARDRVYPAGEHELFGSWGFLGEDQCEPRPREGLELVCDRLLATPPFAGLERRGERYHWFEDRPARGERAHGYVAFAPGSEPPLFETTLDLVLQRFLRAELERTLAQHHAALAQAILLDVESGDVLAVDSVERYPVQPFAPVYHVFTTGSTFKVLTMAIALEEGVVSPQDQLDVGEGEYRIHYPDGQPSGRRIREAEGALTGTHSAAEFFAFSVNAALAQIGLRVPDRRFRPYLERLGYGEAPGAGLGPERAGNLAPLPWKYAYTHASIGFGHEISTTLWQHASALATVVRGGVHRPLRLVRAVAQSGRRLELPVPEGRRLFSQATCEEVRSMMALGAEIGTGRDVGRAFQEALAERLGRPAEPGEFTLGTKTGTAEKVPSELCVHVELSERARWERAGLPATRARVAALSQLAKPHARCYTSSICAFGRAPGSERELMVVVVVEEPRGRERFGSRVAGPAAERILSEALGLTRNGTAPRSELVDGFAPASVRPGELALAAHPWDPSPKGPEVPQVLVKGGP